MSDGTSHYFATGHHSDSGHHSDADHDADSGHNFASGDVTVAFHVTTRSGHQRPHHCFRTQFHDGTSCFCRRNGCLARIRAHCHRDHDQRHIRHDTGAEQRHDRSVRQRNRRQLVQNRIRRNARRSPEQRTFCRNLANWQLGPVFKELRRRRPTDAKRPVLRSGGQHGDRPFTLSRTGSADDGRVRKRSVSHLGRQGVVSLLGHVRKSNLSIFFLKQLFEKCVTLEHCGRSL